MVHIFIINSHAGRRQFSQELRDYLSLHHSDLDYHIFHTRKVGDERRLISEIINLFGDEKMRIYCCGGLGTFGNAIADVEDFSNIEFAFCPHGYTNDFLKVFGNDADLFFDIDRMIDGQVEYIDYIKTNHGNCLNNFSLGLDSEQVRKMTEYRDTTMYGIAVPYLLGFLYSILLSKPEHLEVSIDGKEPFTIRTSELFFGNGCIIGGKIWFDDKACITDGLGRIVIYHYVKKRNMVRTLLELSKKDMSHKHKIYFEGFGNSISIKRVDGTPFIVDCDGEIREAQTEWTATMVQKGLPFVIPKGVNLP